MLRINGPKQYDCVDLDANDSDDEVIITGDSLTNDNVAGQDDDDDDLSPNHQVTVVMRSTRKHISEIEEAEHTPVAETLQQEHHEVVSENFMSYVQLLGFMKS